MSSGPLFWALKQQPGNQLDKMVLIGVCDQTNDKADWSALVALEDLAIFAEATIRAVRTSLGRLQSKELLSYRHTVVTDDHCRSGWLRFYPRIPGCPLLEGLLGEIDWSEPEEITSAAMRNFITRTGEAKDKRHNVGSRPVKRADQDQEHAAPTRNEDPGRADEAPRNEDPGTYPEGDSGGTRNEDPGTYPEGDSGLSSPSSPRSSSSPRSAHDRPVDNSGKEGRNERPSNPMQASLALVDQLPNNARELSAAEAEDLARRIDQVLADREDLDHAALFRHLTTGRLTPTKDAYRAYRKYLQPANLPRVRFGEPDVPEALAAAFKEVNTEPTNVNSSVVLPPKCEGADACDSSRFRENEQGTAYRCPKCHPLAVRVAG